MAENKLKFKEISLNNEDPKLYEYAANFSRFRERCKKYLTVNGMNYDKFTSVPYDSYIGYLSEKVINDYLSEQLIGSASKVESWKEECDIKTIKQAVKLNDFSKSKLVKDYFYDQCDLIVKTPKKDIHIDVKTALTQLKPEPSWEFLYPVVQAKKEGKDFAILAYCIDESQYSLKQLKNDFSLEELYGKLKIDKVIIAGYCDTSTVLHCRLVHSGEKTSHNTLSHIDNYETVLSRHYKDINDLIDKIKLIK